MTQVPQTSYDTLSKLFHWTVAVLIVGLIGLGWYMVGLTYYHPLYHDSLTWHRSLGLIALVLVVGRLLWTLKARRPPPSDSLTAVERGASRAVHVLLRVLMVAMPVSGYVMSTSAGDAVSVFGLVSVPPLLPESEALRDLAIEVHVVTVYGTAALAVVHALAAVKHHFIDRDDTLRRML